MGRLNRFLQFSLCVSLLMGCKAASSSNGRPISLPQDPNVQVFMNQDVSAEYTEPYRKIARSGNDLEQVLIEAISSATSSIDVAVQEFRLPNVAKALRDRAAAGVTVRVILEHQYARPYSAYTRAEIEKLPEREKARYQEARSLIDLNKDGELSEEEILDRDALVILDQAKVPRIDDRADGSRGSGLMHHKFMVVDGKTTIVTSANLTLSDVHGDFARSTSRGNANNLLRINSPELSRAFTEEFELMWRDRKFGVKKPVRPVQQFKIGETLIDLHFSPNSASVPWKQTSNGLIANTLQQSTQSIDLALFVFSDQDLVNSIESRSNIRALIEPTFAYRSYSEALDMLGVALSDNCKWELNNRPWKNPLKTVGVPQLPPGDLLHHKFGIVDRQTVITGSHNWTNAGNRNNDETLLIIRNPKVAAHFQREFDRLYANSILGVPPAIQRKVEAQQKQCPPPTVQANDKLDLNTATQAELEALPGVGSGLAKQIIQARPINSLEDLDRVPGVGKKLIERLRDRVTF
ncbi:phospholipase D-like domain-containing protein [Leptolyngbya sp. AN03gr2]|uniref:phospholipase D-like domain-containing protein n=1 Tax=unclassified Leptolyngbya TaxID=2650499 RepID=UPI003D32086E